MDHKQYVKLAQEKFTNMPLTELLSTREFNRIDCLNMVAKQLFILGDVESELALEIRKQLKSLQEIGVIE